MAFTTEFNNMLMEKASGEMLTQDFMKRDWLLNNVTWDKTWIAAADGTYNSIIVPVEKAKASNTRMAKYKASADLKNRITVRGKEDAVAHLTGSLIFNERDVQIHNSLNEQNLMTLLPKQLTDMVDLMKYQTSQQLMTGRIFAKITDITDVATGILVVDRPERFEIGQAVEIMDATAYTTCLFGDNGGAGGTLGAELYVTAINVSTKQITFSLTHGGAAANLTGVGVADGFQIHDSYIDATNADNSFRNLRNILLPAAAGGDATYLGQTKAAIPFLQPYHSSTLGAAMTSTNMLEKLFRFSVEAKTYQRGFRANNFIMSLSRLGTVMQIVEAHKGMFNVVPGTSKASEYGWSEVRIGNSEMLEFGFVGVQEMDDDVIFALDTRSMKFHTDKGIMKHKDPNGNEFYTTRTEDGYTYIVDYNLWGQMVVYEPYRNGVISGITFTP